MMKEVNSNHLLDLPHWKIWVTLDPGSWKFFAVCATEPQLWCCSYCLYIYGMHWLSNRVQKRSSRLWGGLLKGVHRQPFSHSTMAHHSILVQSSALLCQYNPGVLIVANCWCEQIAAKLLSACLVPGQPTATEGYVHGVTGKVRWAHYK